MDNQFLFDLITRAFLISIKISVVCILSVVIFVFLRYLIDNFIKGRILKHTSGKDEEYVKGIEKRYNTVSKALLTVTKLAIIITVVLLILSIFNINMAPILASLGIIGVALGFGAQSLVKDYINGFYILLENQFNLGDSVEIFGYKGKVEEFNLRRTVLRDINGNVHIIPNSQITSVSNLSKDWSRLEVVIAILDESEIDKAEKLIENILVKISLDDRFKGIFIDEPKLLGINSIENGNVEFKIWGKTKRFKQSEVSRIIRREVAEKFAKEKIQMPQGVYIKQNQLNMKKK